jgi:glyoxylase-like metal-dependent hydrolase (beta-lactamase superfamily II)
MFSKKSLMVTLGISLLGVLSLRAQQPSQPSGGRPAPEPVSTRQVRGNLYQVGGGIGNAFFLVGSDEVLVIDAKISAEAASQMLAEVKKVTERPVRRVVLTHSDGDHVNGLAGFPPHLTIISHANARQDIAKANASAAAKLPLPNETFSKDLTLFLGDTEVRLLYFGPAHTNGDVVVYIPSEKAAVVGDLVFVGRDPLIHASKHGSSFGLVSVLKSLLRMDADVFLSGHADGVDKKAIEALIADIEQKQAKVKALVQEGKTLAEVKAALAGADQPATPGGRRWPSLVEIIYQELTVAPDGRIPDDSGKKETSVQVAPGVTYVLEDGEKSHQQYPDTFEIPSKEERQNLKAGQTVKLMFRITADGKTQTERMWVIVKGKQQGGYLGILDNDPVCTQKMRSGVEVRFEPRHVISIYGDPAHR